MKNLLRLAVALMPWFLRRHILVKCFGYELHPTARIGLSFIFPKHLAMGEGAFIGHLCVAIHLERMEMGAHSILDRGNWITGFPRGHARHFAHLGDRRPEFMVGAHAGISKNHHFDCTERIEIGDHATVAGYGSQFLTHGIDYEKARQHASPISIGARSLVGSRVVVLGGARLPARSVLGAGAVLNKAYEEELRLYAGVPARPVKHLPASAAYFSRSAGFID